jgi:hypothetical protein
VAAERGNVLALRHGAYAERRVKPVATTQKRRLLRQIGLRAGDLDGLGLALLDNYARAQAKVELMDAYADHHGWLDEQGRPPEFVKTYFTALNSARLALGRFADYLKARGVEPSMVAVLQGSARRVQ